MYLFFGLAATVCLIIHTTEAAPLALDRLMLAIAFFNEGKERSVYLLVATFLMIVEILTFKLSVCVSSTLSNL